MKIRKSMLTFAIVISLLCANTLCISAAMVSENTPTSVSLEVNHRMDGDETPSEETFTYALTAVDSAAPLPRETRISIDGEGSASFGEIVFTNPDIYEYTLEQEVVEADNYTYDSTTYEIKVIVRTDALGVLTPEVSAIKQGGTLKSESLLFVNTYKAPVIPEKDDGKIPTTGDTTQIAQLIILAVGTLGCMLIMLVKRKRNANEEVIEKIEK